MVHVWFDMYNGDARDYTWKICGSGCWFGPFFIFPYTVNNNPISEGLKPPTRDAFQIDEKNHPWWNLIQQKLVN